MHTSWHLAVRLSRAASGFEGAPRTVRLSGSVDPCVVFRDAGPGSRERAVILLQDFAARAGIDVRDSVEDEGGATEGSVGALAFVPYGHMRRDLLFLQ